MRKIIVSLLVFALMVMIIPIVYAEPKSSEVINYTSVGGVIWNDTVLSLSNSPYLIINTIQIPENVTLRIESGVKIYSNLKSYSDMFLINGKVIGYGTNDNPIIFDGNKTSNLINPKDSKAETFLDLNYCIIKNCQSFWKPSGYSQYGYFYLRNSKLYNLSYYSFIWYPVKDVFIENNLFDNCYGFSIGLDKNVHVYILNNTFIGNPNINFLIENWASYSTSQTIVKFNNFLNMTGIVLRLSSGDDETKIVATENYWGTTDISVINSIIYDRNDDITIQHFIDFQPIEGSSTVPEFAPICFLLFIVLGTVIVVKTKLPINRSTKLIPTQNMK